MKKFGRTKALGQASAVALVTAALVFTAASAVTGPKSTPNAQGFILTSGSCPANPLSPPNFSVCGPALGAGPVLYPGAAASTLPLKFYNAANVPISVSTLQVTFTNAFPTGSPPCDPTALRVNGPSATASGSPPGSPSGSPPVVTLSFSPYLPVPAGTVANPGTTTYNATLALADIGNQDACENLGLVMSYLASAQYTEVYATATAVTSSLNPSPVGQHVTYTATVTASVTGSQLPVPSSPTGTVTFKDGTTTICTANIPVTSTGTTTSTATCPVTYASTTGSPHSITAVYANSDGNFSGSTSPVLTQVVNASGVATTTALTSSSNPSVFGGSVVFTATVARTSGTGTPTGTVNFYTCTSATNCSPSPSTLLGSGTLSSGKATYSTSSLPVGNTYVEAVYQGVAGSYGSSTSNIVTQVVNLIGTTTSLASAPNPSTVGGSVAFTATVARTSGTGTPTGSVNFYKCTSATNCSPSPSTLLGSGTLSSGKATYSTSSLPVGSTYVEAVYQGVAGSYGSSTSNIVTQVVIALPSTCTGSYTNLIIGNPLFPIINGTNGNDFIYAFGASYIVNGFNGNDCLDAGDGNNVLTDGIGNDVVLAGNGNNVIVVGGGNDKIIVGNGTNTIGAGDGTDTVTAGNGSQNGIILGNGNDSVTVGNGSHNSVIVGSGTDSVTVGSGSYNAVTLGSGTDVVTIQGGSHDTINGGAGNETIYLGAGTYNTYNGAAHHTNVCHLPTGKTAASLHDTITNCTVVTP